jgi:thioredoxin-dependent peroxiredoxin
MISAGAAAPSFSLSDQKGLQHSLAAYSGKYVVLYFYPKDDTPGCTTEACDFRDQHSLLETEGAVVLGVSPDSVESHQRFAGKFGLPFALLADADHQVAEAYGAWGEKNMYGKKYFGIVRSTFLVAPDGTVAQVWPKVKVEGHVDEVLAALRAHRSGTPLAAGEAAAPGKPSPRNVTSSQPAPKKAAAKKAAPRKAAPKKAAPKKAAAKKAAPRKAAPKKAAPKKAPAKKAPAKKAVKRGRR